MVEKEVKNEILYARAEEEVVVVRIFGRANHRLSHTFKRLLDDLNSPGYSPRYLIDLDACVSLDSTFMGIMASLALHQTSCRKERVVLVNSNAITKRQLTMLGLNYLLDIHAVAPQSNNNKEHSVEFQAVEDAESTTSRFDQIVHMIKAHETLVDVSSGNEVAFRGVLDSLKESLDQESSS